MPPPLQLRVPAARHAAHSRTRASSPQTLAICSSQSFPASQWRLSPRSWARCCNGALSSYQAHCVSPPHFPLNSHPHIPPLPPPPRLLLECLGTSNTGCVQLKRNLLLSGGFALPRQVDTPGKKLLLGIAISYVSLVLLVPTANVFVQVLICSYARRSIRCKEEVLQTDTSQGRLLHMHHGRCSIHTYIRCTFM